MRWQTKRGATKIAEKREEGEKETEKEEKRETARRIKSKPELFTC